MTIVRIERESEERLGVTFTTTTDPAAFSVEFSFPERTERPEDWHAGVWVDVATPIRDRFKRRAATPIVGVAGLDLPVGHYDVYARVTADGARPVLKIGNLEVQ